MAVNQMTINKNKNMIWTDELCQKSAIFANRYKKGKIMKIDTEKHLGQNPFLQELVIEATYITDKGKYVKDGDVLVPTHTLVEKQKYTRVYRVPKAKGLAMSLTATGSKMLLYLIYTIEGSQDSIEITPEQYMRATNTTSRNTYKKGVEELWTNGYIQPTVKKYTYWINPAMMFGANRINKWEDKVVIKSEL